MTKVKRNCTISIKDEIPIVKKKAKFICQVTCSGCLKRHVVKKCVIIYQNDDWSQISFLETYNVKSHKTELNDNL